MFLRSPTGFYPVLKSLEFDCLSWKALEFDCLSWKVLEFDCLSWKALEFDCLSWKVLEFLYITKNCLIQFRSIFFIFVSITVRVKNTKYVSKVYFTILPKVTPLMTVCCLGFKPQDYALPPAISVDRVAFLELLHVFCITNKCVFNWKWLSQPQ